jgi:class 3 adenylate cyclase
MLKELADLLKDKEPVMRKSSERKIQEERNNLTEKEIDEILLNAWENCITETEQANIDTERALDASQAIGYMKGIATAFRNKAYLKMLQSDYKHSLEDARFCLKLIDENDMQLAGTAWDIIALNYNGLGLYEKSVESTYKSLRLFEKTRYKRGISWAHHNLAIVYSNIGEIEKADKEFRNSLKQFKKMGHIEGVIRVCSLLSQNLRKENKFSEAMKYLQHADELIPDDESSVQSFSNKLNLGITKRLMGKLDESVTYFDKSKIIISKIENTELLAQYEYETALLSQDLGDLKSSISHLDTALELSTRIDSKLIRKDITHALSNVHEEMGHSIEALKYFKLYDRLSRELLNREDLQRIHNMEVQKDIEIAEKEKEYHRRLQEETEKILKNVLPVPIVEELKSSGFVKPKRISSATALFTDFVGFTAMSSHTSPEEIVTQLDYCFTGFDKIMDDLGIEKLKTIGDGYMAVAGALTENEKHTELCVEAGLRIQQFMKEYIEMRKEEGKEFWGVRIGIHRGPLIAGVIGNKKFAYDVWGDTVNIASRIESGGLVGMVNISGEVYETVKDQFSCTSAGEVEAKGKGKLSIYTVEG